jgi:branched-chain amino acid transport system ATP-binding protein
VTPGAGPGVATEAQAAALRLSDVTAGYGRTVVLRNLNLEVPPGRVVSLLGPNGVGKTTLLRVASGLLSSSRGSVHVNGVDVSRLPAYKRTKLGLCLIPEGRGIFRSLSVAENLRLQSPPWQSDTSIEKAVEAFPVLGKRLSQRAGSMSGGEQQMLALARAYLSSPAVVLLDEVSMGLSPKLVEEVFATIRKLAALGVTLLIVEQYVNRALEVSDLIVLLDKGSVSFAGPPSDLDSQSLVSHYLGVGELPKAAGANPVVKLSR